MRAYEQMQLAAERTFDSQRRIFGEDLCDLIGPTFADGGASGDSVDMGAVATNIECFIEGLSAAEGPTVVGGETFISSHRVTTKKNSNTQAVTPRYRIRVHARDGKAERIFEKPVTGDESFTPLMVFKASLVRQGYQT